MNSFGSFGGLSTIDRKNQKKSITFFCEKHYLSCLGVLLKFLSMNSGTYFLHKMVEYLYSISLENKYFQFFT
jgi:hypothetical protein